jgi:RNA polymerase sigma factor (sigma-70 family)
MDESVGPDHLIGLMRRAVAGDNVALEDLLARLYTPISRFLRRRFGGDPHAESWIDDLTQETLLRVIRFLGDCSATSNGQLMAWVLVIARRVSIDWLRSPDMRKGKSFISMEGDELAGHASSEAWDPPADRSNLLLKDVLLSTLAASHDVLPEPTQRLIWLHVILGASWPEIGQAMHMTAYAAKRRWQRAQNRLRKEIIRRIHELPEGDRAPLVPTMRRLGIEL